MQKLVYEMRISDWGADLCSSDLIWRGAQPLPASPAKAYLEGRGIVAASSALRFHPRTPLGPKGRTRFLPAMIAAVGLDEGPIAIQLGRTSGRERVRLSV